MTDGEPLDTPTRKKVAKLTPQERIKAAYTCDALDLKIIEVLFDQPAVSFRELAALVGSNVTTVQRRVKKPAVKKRLEEMRATVTDLIKRAQVLSVRRLMQLITSKDEWVALQACKIATAPLLSVHNLNVTGTQRMVYEVQIGPQGQVFQTAKPLTDPSANPQGFPTTLDLVVEGGLAQAPRIGETA